MPNIRSIDMLFLDELFEMRGGYVLNLASRLSLPSPAGSRIGPCRDSLSRELPLNHVLERKVRRAAETGLPFTRVRDLFPT